MSDERRDSDRRGAYGGGAPHLVIAASPFVKRDVETPVVMRHVAYAALPATLAAVWLFGVSAVAVILACVLGAVGAEWVVTGCRPWRDSPVRDGSALVTGLLLALTLPPGLPAWMAWLGGVVAIVIGKSIFGGLGMNVFNPSLTGRAFLQASFPVAMTTWSPQAGPHAFLRLHGDTFAFPFATPHVDAVSAATPLAQMKFEHSVPVLRDLIVGSVPGSLGETSALLLLAGGLYLAWRRFLDWRIPVAIFASVFVASTALHLVDPVRFPPGAHQLVSGGLVLGALFMATDPVTSPVTPLGAWIFGIGTGLLVVAIRQFGGLPEGVMFAILLMNGVTPLIDRWTQPRVYGTGRSS